MTSKNCSAGDSAGFKLALGFGLLVAGCWYDDQPTSRKMNDERAVAMVEAAQTQLPPRRTLQPQPLPSEMSHVPGTPGAGCAFSLGENPKDPIFRAGPTRGQVKIEGALVGLSSDSGSLEVTPGLRQQYDGKKISLEVARDANDTTNIARGTRWPAKITIRDEYERPVYFGVGTMNCES